MKRLIFVFLTAITLPLSAKNKDVFPDGTPIPDWFRDTEVIKIKETVKNYIKIGRASCRERVYDQV